MDRRAKNALLALSLFLIAFPLALPRQGQPAGTKADEPAYFMMAQSIAFDRDLTVTLVDLGRMVDAFPFGSVKNLILASDDGWHSVHFGKPYAYSLFAAPAVALFGAKGMIAFNMALYLAMLWLGVLWLERFNPSGRAVLFSVGFFLLSAGAAYVFWLHPEVFNMAGVTACLFFGLAPRRHEAEEKTAQTASPSRWSRGSRRVRASLRSPLVPALLSGAVLAPAVYNKPMLLALALPVAVHHLVRPVAWKRRLLPLAAWGAGFAVVMVGLAGLAVAWTGHPTAYMGMARGSFEICDPDVMPVTPTAVPEQADRPRAAAWGWILRVPEIPAGETLENLGYFFWGRHTGLLFYFPFAVLSVVLFLLALLRRRRGGDRRSGETGGADDGTPRRTAAEPPPAVRWANLAGIAAVALFFLIWIPFNWQGGGGFIGNRYFVNAYPAFLFLVTRLGPPALTLAGYLVGGFFLGCILLTPLGRSVPAPTLQSHVRAFPYRHLPLELSLRQIPGYERTWTDGGTLLVGRHDVYLQRGETGFWVRGGTSSEVLVVSPEPIDDLALQVQSFAADNPVDLSFGEAEERLVLGGDEVRRLVLDPGEPNRIRRLRAGTAYVYRLELSPATGEIRQFTRPTPPRVCTYFAHNPSWEESFYVGLEVHLLGDPERLERDVFAASWQAAEAPDRVAPGERFTVTARLVNESEAAWPADGPVRVNLSYHWIDRYRRLVEFEGRRTALPREVAPGETVEAEMQVVAPSEPGLYTLILDPVYEQVGWFSDRAEGATERLEVRVGAEAGDRE